MLKRRGCPTRKSGTTRSEMRFAGAAGGATLFWAYARTERVEKAEHFRRIRGYSAMAKLTGERWYQRFPGCVCLYRAMFLTIHIGIRKLTIDCSLLLGSCQRVLACPFVEVFVQVFDRLLLLPKFQGKDIPT